jgi:cytoskeletal protein CcmA (bactofilin family)
MKMFKRHDTTVRATNTAPAGYSVLDAQVTVRGDIETDGMLRIDGRLEGNIKRASVVLLGAGASINGDVNARELVVGGRIVGNIVAEARVEVEATAEVDGDIEADAILIHEGGAVRGRLFVRTRGESGADRRLMPASAPETSNTRPLQLSIAQTGS